MNSKQTPLAVGREHKAQIQRDASELLYENGISGVIVSIIAASALVFGFDSKPPFVFKTAWWAAMLMLHVVRFGTLLHWRKKLKPTAYDGRRATLIFVCGTWLTGLMWCVYCVVMRPYMSMVELTVAIIIVSALGGGAANVLAAHKPTVIFYPFVLLFPFSVSMVLSGISEQTILGALGIVFSGVMFVTAFKSATFTHKAIKLKNENLFLVNHMEKEVEVRTQQIYELSNIDSLSKLLNRNAFIRHLCSALETVKSQNCELALLFIDLDGFKAINANMGHSIGDKVLFETSSRLKQAVPDAQLLCRWGGDEFVVAVPNSSESKAINTANQLIHAISQEVMIDNQRLSVGATVGISMYPHDADDEERLIQMADIAMYDQKKRCPGAANLFNESIGHSLQREHWIASALDKAIEHNAMRLVFQPIFDVKQQRPVSFEALLRWRCEEQDIAPYEFIKIAEQKGKILSIGKWVLEQACLEASTWRDFEDMSINVNVSVIQLLSADFLETVEHALELSDLSPARLNIEITESVFAFDRDKIFFVVKSLQQKGIRVSIDDFGTEYSSLSLVQELSADTVKIDRTFIANLSSKGYPIVNAVTHIAKAFDYQVVAEGVETPLQLERLKQLGVTLIQGFLFAKPMEKDDFYAYLDKFRSAEEQAPKELNGKKT